MSVVVSLMIVGSVKPKPSLALLIAVMAICREGVRREALGCERGRTPFRFCEPSASSTLGRSVRKLPSVQGTRDHRPYLDRVSRHQYRTTDKHRATTHGCRTVTRKLAFANAGPSSAFKHAYVSPPVHPASSASWL